MANNISEKGLKYGSWYVNHKIFLRQLLIAGLFLLNALLWGYILFSLFYNFVLKYNDYQQLKADLLFDRYTNYQGILDMTVPRPINVLSIQTLNSVENKLDIVAQVSNPNQKWFGHFKYSFATSSGATQLRDGFILPGETKYLYDLDVAAASVQNIDIGKVDWLRENNYPQLAAERDQFQYTDVSFIPAGTADGLSANRAVFTVTNNSNFNYYHPTFLVLLKRGGQIVGFNAVAAPNLLSHTKINLESRWFESLPDVENVEIVPDIDYLSDSSYIPI